MIYYIENYYTEEIIDVSSNLNKAIEVCKSSDDTMVTDENDNCYYTNIELPF